MSEQRAPSASGAPTARTGADSLAAPVDTLPGVGPTLRGRLERLGVERVGDLLFRLPLRYEDRSRVTRIGALRPGRAALVEGRILAADVVTGRRRSLIAHLQDGSGTLLLRLFHFSPRQRTQLKPGAQLRCFGDPRSGPMGMEMVHPEYRILQPGREPPLPEHLTPVYPTTEGLGQARLRELTRQALGAMHAERAFEAELRTALATVHTPPLDSDLDALNEGRHPAQRRLALDELLAHQLSLLRLRRRTRQRRAPRLAGSGELLDAFQRTLDFELTAAQRRVTEHILGDLREEHPMLRLLQGDVGSGKTVVAALAAIRAAESGYQTALMAPTELLAEQHHATLDRWLEPLGIETALVTSRQRTSERRAAVARIADGEVAIAVGTHALFQDELAFAALGLVVIDEQHRFGVHQRLALRAKGDRAKRVPHQLVMTATPIPRTLAMSAYADLDVSVIDELPAGRKPVHTIVLSEDRREEVIERVSRACRAGRQAYWVCTLIEESEALQCQAAEATAERLRSELPDLGIALVHGRMRAGEKTAAMERFAAGAVDLLVATTVIEVGVDVPNASLMVIENAERLGLAQLHQLRGRVGRGDLQSHCVLLYQRPLGEAGRARLGAMRAGNDGFAIAERDLEIRGPGELLGTRQTGLADLKVAALPRDRDLLYEVREQAAELLRTDPKRAEAIIERWLAGRERYAEV